MLKNVIEKSVILLFCFSMIITLFGSFRSSILFSPDMKAGPLLVLLFVFFLVSCVMVYKGFRYRLNNAFLYLKDRFWANRRIITLLLSILVFIAQLIVIKTVSAPISWDVGSIYGGVQAMPDSEYISNYLSINPNNSFFFFIMYLCNKIMNFLVSGNIGWVHWQLFNALVLDISFVVLSKAASNLFSVKIGYTVFYFSLFSLSLSPWILVPYTDTFSFGLISSIFLIYSIYRCSIKKSAKVVLRILLSVLIGLAFLLKPSSIIFFIAWTLFKAVELIYEEKKSVQVHKLFVFIQSIILFLSAIIFFNLFLNHQKLVSIDDEQAKPSIHFIMMGMKNDGGYNQEDVDTVNAINGKENKKAYISKEIRMRLKDFGFLGYMKFLMKKHFNNTSNGDFGWGRDGRPQVPGEVATSKFQSILRDWYYQQGNRVNNIRFFMHIIWLGVLSSSLFTVFIKTSDKKMSQLIYIMMLSVIGIFLYLLIFEGGRSRYLIQYLPIFFMLAGIGAQTLIQRLSAKK
ncbi:hypothetical protein JZO70_21200 [Enterococcus sp. 669A]|uniref:Glycosyltransferase RgtA/B/C/D-like domain-containing protein n=1 Tax=Candidatus Enterococcus moelleringii TaxID=2815325 RepID=A0ABS3LGE9_9ENTE|nr:hypothetical protein [Enterococcus sp. 669A]MBO1308705.1 hypothetical protein [Enterococcus sp. 669A]